MKNDGYINWKDWCEQDFGVTGPGSRFHFEQIFTLNLDRLKSSDSNPLVLEIGFGNGELLGFFRSEGCEVIGVEINDLLVNRANAKGYLAYLGNVWHLDALQNKKFDLIVAFSVLEHLTYEDAVSLFEWVASHLNPMGRFFLQFPEGASPFGMANQNGDFTHISFITKSKINSLCNGSGLALDCYYDDFLSSNKLCSFGWGGVMFLRALQVYSTLIKFILKVIFYPISHTAKFGTNSIAVVMAKTGK